MSLVEQIKIVCLQEGRGFQRAILLDGPAASAASSASFLLRAVALLAALTTKKRVVPTMMKLITALKKLPYAIPFHDNLERFSTLAALTTGLRISGVMISLTSEDDSVESSPHNNGYSKIKDVTLEQKKSLSSLIILTMNPFFLFTFNSLSDFVNLGQGICS